MRRSGRLNSRKACSCSLPEQWVGAPISGCSSTRTVRRPIAAAVPAAVTFKRGFLTITQGRARVFLNVEVADTPESHAQGLGNRTSLPPNAGMLFVFETTNLWAFWMKNTLIPLTVAFIDEQWEIVELIDMAVAKDPQNRPFEIYKPVKTSHYPFDA